MKQYDDNDDLNLDEDFGIGVGAPCGLDQGIPHGGDCKGCCPQRMGLLYQRSPYSINPFYAGVADAHHPGYWLKQIPKKKRRKKKRRKLHEDAQSKNELLNYLKNQCFELYYKRCGKEDCANEHATREELYQHFTKGFENDLTPPVRSYEIGKFARRICIHAYDEDDIEQVMDHYKRELKLATKLLA